MGLNLSCFDKTLIQTNQDTLIQQTISDEEHTEFRGNICLKIENSEKNLVFQSQSDLTPKLKSNFPALPIVINPFYSPQKSRIYSSNAIESSVNLIKIISPCSSAAHSSRTSRCISPISISKN